MVRLYPYRRTLSAPVKGKDEEARWDGGGRHQHYLRDLPEGPTYLSKEALQARVQPPDSQMALACLFANRYYTQARMAVACRKLYNSEPSILLHDQYEDKKVGLRMITFITEVQELDDDGKVAAAVFAFRGTRLTKAGTVSADIQLVKDRNAEMYITQRAMKHVAKEIRRLHKEFPDVQWGFFTTGHSLGALTAIVCTILCNRILASINFESPGLTTYYHRLAAEVGDEAFWQKKVINYLAIPNPINMCQRHLGKIYRVHFPRIECQTDALHVAKCLFATAVRFCNWILAASTGYAALRLLLGVSASAAACASLLMSEGATLGCAIELAATPAGLTRGMYWTLHSASAYVAAKLGTNLRYILQQHSQWHMAQAFDGKTGLPYKAVEMRSWPKMERMSGSFRRTFTRAVIESFYATDTSEGIWVMFRRNALIEARIRMLPGYEPLRSADEDAASLASESSNAWVWNLGDVFELWADDGEGAEHEVADLEGFDRSSRRRDARLASGRSRCGEDADSEAEFSSAVIPQPSGVGDDTDDMAASSMVRTNSEPALKWWSRFPSRRRRSSTVDPTMRRLPSVVLEGQERQAEGWRSTSMDGGVHRPAQGVGAGPGTDLAELGPANCEQHWPPLSTQPDEGVQDRTAGAISGSESSRGRPDSLRRQLWERVRIGGGRGGLQKENAWYVVDKEGMDERGRVGDVRWLQGHYSTAGKTAEPGERGVQSPSLRHVRGKAAATETDTGQGGETETDTGAVYTDLEAEGLAEDGDTCVLDSEAGVVLGGSPKCVLLSGPENAAEYYGWSAADHGPQNRFRFGFWPRRTPEGEPKP